jgi:putative transposase
LASVDFTIIWAKGGLVIIYLRYVMKLASRRVHFARSTTNPDEPWILQVASVSDAEAGFLREKKYVLMDREAKRSEEFRSILEQTGVEAVRLPPRHQI